MKAHDNSTDTAYDVDAMQQAITLADVEGGNAGSVTLNLLTENDKPTHYKYDILSNNNSVTNGYFDANSQAIVTGLENNIEYTVNISVDDELASDWLDDVATVTDVFLVFKEAIKAGSNPGGSTNTFTHSIQFLLGEVNNSGNVDFDDSYVLLSHIMDENVSEWLQALQTVLKMFGEKKTNMVIQLMIITLDRKKCLHLLMRTRCLILGMALLVMLIFHIHLNL